jgi:hypothetical protein
VVVVVMAYQVMGVVAEEEKKFLEGVEEEVN